MNVPPDFGQQVLVVSMISIPEMKIIMMHVGETRSCSGRVAGYLHVIRAKVWQAYQARFEYTGFDL